MSGFTVVQKAPNYRKFFEKNPPVKILVQIRSSKRRADIFLKCVSRYLTFGDFTVPKSCSSQRNY